MPEGPSNPTEDKQRQSRVVLGIGFYMMLGGILGAGLGAAMKNVAVGVAIGMPLGAAVGLAISSQPPKKGNSSGVEK